MHNPNPNFPNFITPSELIKSGLKKLSAPGIYLDKILDQVIEYDRSDVLGQMLSAGMHPHIELQIWGCEQSLTDFCLDYDAKKCIKKLIDVFDLDAIEPSRTALTAMLRNDNRAQYFQFFVERGLKSNIVHSEDKWGVSPFIACLYTEEQSERDKSETNRLQLPVSHEIVNHFNTAKDLHLFQESIDKNIDKMIEVGGTTEALLLMKQKVTSMIERQALDQGLKKIEVSTKLTHKI